jgi:hypothetical protein
MSYFIVDRESNGLYEITTNAIGQLAPIAYPGSISVPFQTATPVKLVATDANNDTLTYVTDTLPANGTLSGSGANRVYTPNAGFSGVDSFTFHANDGTTDSNVATVTLNVHALNRPPVLSNITSPKLVNELDLLTFKPTATDPDGDAVTFSLQNAPAGAKITPAGLFTWRPTEAQGPGSYNITVRVTDPGALFDSQVVTVNVNEVGGGGGGGGGGNGTFIDDNDSVFEAAIEWLYAQGITQGCNPPVNDRFCPDDPVSRGQMAGFLTRALNYTDAGTGNYFTDTSSSVFKSAIDKLRVAGVTLGCNPPANTMYCPGGFVTREQMAGFLTRALEYTDSGTGNYFTDTGGSVFKTAIDRLRVAGVTLGCNPPANDKYCPDELVSRGQMAAFLKRALEG